MRPALAFEPEPLLEGAETERSPAPDPASKSLLRFITCGSVDDGKSSLLGRLLWETNSVFEDQAEALIRDSARFGTTGKTPDLALLVDGLAAEREQGITIDVAYRYFSTPRRAFIAADTPGHEQYTRNMATGASTADCAIILVDARKGLLPQTRRHSYIVSMLGVRDVIIAINKMDLVEYSEAVFRAIERDYLALAPRLGFTRVHILPLSAREGDNVTRPSSRTPWYAGPSLLGLLETMDTRTGGDANFRFPVQWVNRPDADFRGFSGTIASGRLHLGDGVTILPRGGQSRITRILTPSGERKAAQQGEAITLALADEIDVSRGDVIVATGSVMPASRRVTARLLALAEAGIEPGRTYLVKLGTSLTRARIPALHHAIDVHDYRAQPVQVLPMNAIGLTTIEFEAPVYATRYAECRPLGSLLLIDTITNDALALGVIEDIEPAHPPSAQPLSSPYKPRLAGILVRLGVVPAGASRLDLARLASWRLSCALLLGTVLFMLSASPGMALGVALVDLLLRPIWRGMHERVWLRWTRRQAREPLGIDGGGI